MFNFVLSYNRTTQELDELKAELNRLTETIESTKVKKEKELSISQVFNIKSSCFTCEYIYCNVRV
jgi:hypothetical protein